MEQNQFVQKIAEAAPHIASSLVAVAAIAVVATALNFAAERLISLAAKRASLVKGDLAPVARAVRWAIRALAVVAIAGALGFELGGIWAMVSTVLAMVAIGFVAVWSVLSNMSATMLILVLRPFQIGDDVEIAGDPVKGRVVDLNFFYTTLLGSDGRLMQVPNNIFFQRTLKRRKGEWSVSLAYQLNNPQPAPLDPPPADQGDHSGPASRRAADPDPLMMAADPRSVAPRTGGR